MIVQLKEALAETIEEALKRDAKITTSRFNETDSNKPQKDREIRITHTGSNWVKAGKGAYRRNYRYSIVIAVKNLRTDNEIQNLCDSVAYALLAGNAFGHEIVIETDTHDGINENGIWAYTLTVYIGIPTDKDTKDCQFRRQDFTFDSIAINLYPDYTIGQI